MCFVTSKIGKATKAIENIKVFKIIGKDNFGLHYNLIFKRKHYPWEIGMWYTQTDFPKIWSIRRSQLGRGGFHSSKNIPSLFKFWSSENLKIGVFIIPKGSYYYENSVDYVSSDIIYLKDL